MNGEYNAQRLTDSVSDFVRCIQNNKNVYFGIIFYNGITGLRDKYWRKEKPQWNDNFFIPTSCQLAHSFVPREWAHPFLMQNCENSGRDKGSDSRSGEGNRYYLPVWNVGYYSQHVKSVYEILLVIITILTTTIIIYNKIERKTRINYR